MIVKVVNDDHFKQVRTFQVKLQIKHREKWALKKLTGSAMVIIKTPFHNQKLKFARIWCIETRRSIGIKVISDDLIWGDKASFTLMFLH